MSEAGAAQSRPGAPKPAQPTRRGPAPRAAPAEGLGVYVHIPFCARRCDYCAFATWTDLHHLTAAYVDACLTEINRAYDAGLGPAATVFVGGGTPSQLPGDELARLLGGIRLLEGAEVTVECNPEDVSTEAPAHLRRRRRDADLDRRAVARAARARQPRPAPRAGGR